MVCRNLNEGRHIALHMEKRKDFLSEAMPQVKYSAKSGKAEMEMKHRLGWIMADERSVE